MIAAINFCYSISQLEYLEGYTQHAANTSVTEELAEALASTSNQEDSVHIYKTSESTSKQVKTHPATSDHDYLPKKKDET